MHPILNLLRKNFLGFRRNRTAVLLTFLMPVALMAVFGAAFGFFGKKPGPGGFPLVVINHCQAPEITKIIAQLEAEPTFRVWRTWRDDQGQARPYTEDKVRTAIQSGKSDYHFALVFPVDALSDARFGLRLKLLYDPRNEIETQTVMGLLQKTVFTAAPSFLAGSLRQQATRAIGPANANQFYDRLADNVATAFGGDREKIRRSMDAGGDPFAGVGQTTSGGSSDLLGRIVQFDKEQLVGREVKNEYATRLVGGWAVMFLMFSVTSASAALLAERDAGLFLRLLSMPITRADILWSKYLFNFILGLVQLTTCFLAGNILFGIELLPNLSVLIVAGLCTSAACTAVGMLLAAVCRSQETARGMSTLVILMMSALGGAWFPVAGGGVMGFLSKCTITYWAQEAFAQALWVRAPLAQAWPVLAMLLAIAAVLNALSLVLFRRGAMFR